ncbi:autophagy-like protein [Tasmannia lanceolata]|uniref:autophagy-like protein n=1 Tax=Tasmannia lanceolata TaxID=3420 RepID=UPI00406417B7
MKIKKWVFLALCLFLKSLNFSVYAVCELSVMHRDHLYNFSLTQPTLKHPHGVLSEDGFYKVAVNETLLWFQLCDQMLFNHDPPRCFGCEDCGGSLHCGMKCSALVASSNGGYDVCKTIGKTSNLDITLIDKEDPPKGVSVKMSASGSKINCSLSVSVLCDLNGNLAPYSLDKLGTCDYATVLRHPSGCAKIISIRGRGWGWFGTLIIILLCLLGGYLLAGTVYRFVFLGVRGLEVVPNMDFWLSLPQRSKSLLGSLLRRLRSRPRSSQNSYSPMNY